MKTIKHKGRKGWQPSRDMKALFRNINNTPDAQASHLAKPGEVFSLDGAALAAYNSAPTIFDVITRANGVASFNARQNIWGTPELVNLFNSMDSGSSLIAALRTYAAGYNRQANLNAERLFLSPDVEVDSNIAQFTSWVNALTGAENDADDRVPPMSEPKAINEGGEQVIEKLYDRALAYDIDIRVTRDLQKATQRAVSILSDRFELNGLKRSADAMTALGNNRAKTWDATAGTDADADVKLHILDGFTGTLVRANRVFYGETAWQYRQDSLAAQTAPALANRSTYDETQLARYLGVGQVMQSKAAQKSSTGAISRVVSNLVLAFFADDSPGLEDASVLKTFWTPEQGGARYRLWEPRQIGAFKWRVVMSSCDAVYPAGPAVNTVRQITASNS